MTATSSTASSKTRSFAFDGFVKPQILRTNWSEAARISASVTGGSKLNSVRMFRHMGRPRQLAISATLGTPARLSRSARQGAEFHEGGVACIVQHAGPGRVRHGLVHIAAARVEVALVVRKVGARHLDAQ